MIDGIQHRFRNSSTGCLETLYMRGRRRTLVAYLIGMPLGVILCITDKNGICPLRPVNLLLGVIINILRSVPFLILLVAVMPFTRAIVGTNAPAPAQPSCPWSLPPRPLWPGWWNLP